MQAPYPLQPTRARLWTQALARVRAPLTGGALARGVVMGYLSLIVLLPLAAIVWQATRGSASFLWLVISSPPVIAALELTFFTASAVMGINLVTGLLLAWVLVRDSFRGKGIVNTVIDLPFALPTIVAGLTLLTLYGPQSPLGVDVAYTRIGIGLALLFVTLPFVVRSVQPVLIELDRDMEEAAATLGAGRLAIFRRIVMPNLMPALLSGGALGFARALGEFGSVVLISGNIPFQTEVASVHIYNQVESDDVTGAAAVALVLLAMSLLVLAGVGSAGRRSARGTSTEAYRGR